jgi:hypothetical protein
MATSDRENQEWKASKKLDKFQQIQRQFIDRGLTHIGQGSGRAVYLSPSGMFVYKVPLHEFGLQANKREHQIYRHPEINHGYLSKDRVARCRLAPSGVLVMELVRTVDSRGARLASNLPEWAYHVDSFQVGTNRAGQAVAYDYGGE